MFFYYFCRYKTKFLRFTAMKKLQKIYLLLLLPLFFASCSPNDDEDYTKKWIGSWKTSDQLNFPLTKAVYHGTISKVDGVDNKVVVDGGLFDLNSSFQMPMQLSSEYEASFNYTSGVRLEGTAKMNNNKDTLTFYLTVTIDNKSIKDTIKATKN